MNESLLSFLNGMIGTYWQTIKRVLTVPPRLSITVHSLLTSVLCELAKTVIIVGADFIFCVVKQMLYVEVFYFSDWWWWESEFKMVTPHVVLLLTQPDSPPTWPHCFSCDTSPRSF